MIPATRLPLRRLPRLSVIFSVGVATLLLGGTLSLAGLPAPAGVVHGAPDLTAAPGSPDGPPGGPSSPPAGGGGRSAHRHAAPAGDLCDRGPATIAPAEVAYHGSRDKKVVALTFDDGWGSRTLRKILRTLRDKHVNATFFPVGQAVRNNPQTWRRIADAGFPIADHTFDHAKLKGQCYLEQRAELTRARAVYRRVLGVEPLPVMRPPGGFFDDATLVAATAAGESALVLWDVDSHDWTGIGSRQVRRNSVVGTKGSIVVLHTDSWGTVRALPDIIRAYRKRGFEFVTIGQLLGIDGAVPFPPKGEAEAEPTESEPTDTGG